MIGIDIVAIDRIGDLYKKFGEKFLYKIFNEIEIEEIKKIDYKKRRIEKIAGKFAAKEAVIKVFEGNNINFKDIVIVNSSGGSPTCFVNGKSVKISISHEKDYAVAVALLQSI